MVSRTFTFTVAAPPPEVVLKAAVVEFGSEVSDGRLVEAVALPWFEIMRMIKAEPESIYAIDPFKWEEIIAGAYTRAGFDKVILTRRSGDHGRDVIATKYGIGTIRFFDQVKAYRPGHVVPAETVRAMIGTITGYQSVERNHHDDIHVRAENYGGRFCACTCSAPNRTQGPSPVC